MVAVSILTNGFSFNVANLQQRQPLAPYLTIVCYNLKSFTLKKDFL